MASLDVQNGDDGLLISYIGGIEVVGSGLQGLTVVKVAQHFTGGIKVAIVDERKAEVVAGRSVEVSDPCVLSRDVTNKDDGVIGHVAFIELLGLHTRA